MRTKDLMTPATHVCRPDHTLREAAGLMWEHDCGFLPVIGEDGRVVGVITDRDVCLAAYRAVRDFSSMPVADCMSQPVRSCSPDDTFDAAADAMERHHVRRLVVVDTAGRLQGVVSLDDLARAAFADVRSDERHGKIHKVAETLAILGGGPTHPHRAGGGGLPVGVPSRRAV
jgi:CBS domain-containing protein